ncbi:MAG: class I SAM-dependent methyltransferase [Gemmatimonadota bacterium]
MKHSPPATLERIVPEGLESGSATGQETLELHLARYRFAVEHIPAGVVLDLACGVGYGSAMLANSPAISMVVAGDISRAALAHAKAVYSHPRVKLCCGSYADSFRPRSFDAIVSLETIEHVPDPAKLVGQFARLLRPGGRLIASVPVTPSVDANPHHLTDFSRNSFLRLGRSAGFTPLFRLEQTQPYSMFRVLSRTEQRTQDLRRGLLGYYLTHPMSALRRAVSTARYGFTNRYLTVVWQLE